ncbi:hypothetical protein [Streptomyces sp. NPDC055287]
MRKNVAMTVGAIALAFGGVLGTAGQSFAGSNGQQVAVSTHYSDEISLCGNNQNGDFDCTGYLPSPNQWTQVSGWWWKGVVIVYGVRYDTADGSPEYRMAECEVPVRQAADWTWCDLYNEL